MRTANFMACLTILLFGNAPASGQTDFSSGPTLGLHNDGDTTSTVVDLTDVQVHPLGTKLTAFLNIRVITPQRRVIEIIPDVTGLAAGQVELDLRSNTPERQPFANYHINCKVEIDGVEQTGRVTVLVDGVLYNDRQNNLVKKFVHLTWQLASGSQIDVRSIERCAYCHRTCCGCQLRTKTVTILQTAVHPCNPDDELLVP